MVTEMETLHFEFDELVLVATDDRAFTGIATLVLGVANNHVKPVLCDAEKH